MITTAPGTRRWMRAMAAGVILLFVAVEARAQGAPGEADPTTFAFRLGPVLLTPGLQVSELGIDTNVFQEAVDPKQDFVVSAAPDLSVFMRTRFIRFTMATAADFTYYQTYESERSVGQHLTGRMDFLLSRLKPYVSATRTNSFKRPNKEIDIRAEHLTPIEEGGVYFEWSPSSNIFTTATRTRIQYRKGETFNGVALDEAMNRSTWAYTGGLTTSLSPLTTVSFTGTYEDTQFDFDGSRNTISRGADVAVSFGPEAVMRGNMRVGYRDFRPQDPQVKAFKGVLLGGGLNIPVTDRATIGLQVARDIQFSFDTSQAYYLDNNGTLTYTQRVLGPFDLQITGGYSRLDYGRHEGVPPTDETMETYGGGLGYNLKDQSRMGLNYEIVNRRSTTDPDRRFTRRRVFGSWTYRF